MTKVHDHSIYIIKYGCLFLKVPVVGNCHNKFEKKNNREKNKVSPVNHNIYVHHAKALYTQAVVFIGPSVNAIFSKLFFYLDFSHFIKAQNLDFFCWPVPY